MALARFAHANGAPAPMPRFDAQFSTLQRASGSVGLLTPQTYMNDSGRSVSLLRDAYPDLPLSGIVIVHDDLDLPLGRIRLRGRGGDGGQRGLGDILSVLGTREVARLRIGIGRPPQDVSVRDHVLSDFSAEERLTLGESLDRAAQALLVWMERGLDHAMDAFNAAALPTANAAAANGDAESS
jgi:PTH1 family peptidyl-tRNA hydrolase